MNYLESLERAIEYIEAHLEDELVSEDIAKAAGYSLYHLTHIFTAVIGEPIGSYIQKRRLSNSCTKLLYSDKRILDIALECGFSSSEAFSRAFKGSYGISPAGYRKNGVDLYTGSKKMLDRDRLLHLAEGVTLNPIIVEMDEIEIAGIRSETSTQRNILPGLWNKLNATVKGIPGTSGLRRFGVCETDRGAVAIEEEGNVRFSEMVGIEVPRSGELPESFMRRVISGGKYAIFTHTGTLDTLLKTYDYIWGSWVLFTKEVLDDREDFEIYDGRFLGDGCPKSEIDIYIPVK